MDQPKKGDAARKIRPKEQIPRLASELGIDVNEPFDYFVMPSEHGPTRVTLADGMTATVIAPDASWLRRWYRTWRNEAERWGGDEDDLVKQTSLAATEASSLDEAVLAISEGFSSPQIELLRAADDFFALPPPPGSDISIANQSSIVSLLEFGGRRMLICGDSRCDHISLGLSQAGLLPREGRLHLDVIQLPHYGSVRNITPEFLARVTADHYVITPAQVFKRPTDESLEMIVGARGDAQYAIHLPALAALTWLDSTKWSPLLRERVVFHDKPTFTISVS